jgi:Putative prokaryotic signal transducing protein
MKFVQLESFTNYIDANIIAGRLEEEDIHCWLKDENTSTINPMWDNAIGGIKLMVAEVQAERALALLQQYKQEKRDLLLCPYCHSHNIEEKGAPEKPGYWLNALLAFFAAGPDMQKAKTWHCNACHKNFEQPEEKQPPAE